MQYITVVMIMMACIISQTTARSLRHARASASFIGFRVHLPQQSLSYATKFSSGDGAAGATDAGRKKAEANMKKKQAQQRKKESGGGATTENKTFRLDRLLSNRGVGSRMEVTALIRRGHVTAEDGQVIKDSSLHVPSTAVFLVGDQVIKPLPLLLAYHKPFGVHSTIGDPLGRPNLEDVLPSRYAKSFHPVGRLDADTTGLLLFSAEGQLTQRLLHPSSNVQREYVARLEGLVDEASLRQVLAAGVGTADGTYEANLLNVEPPSLVRVGVAEGKHRMVRRILANAGHPVIDLHRIRYGVIDLGDLGEGQFREVEGEEHDWAEALMRSKAKKKERGEEDGL